MYSRENLRERERGGKKEEYMRLTSKKREKIERHILYMFNWEREKKQAFMFCGKKDWKGGEVNKKN